MVTEFLKMPELVDQNRMTEMQVWRCRIKPRLDPERLTSLESLNEFRFDEQLLGPALDQRQRVPQVVHIYPIRDHIPYGNAGSKTIAADRAQAT